MGRAGLRAVALLLIVSSRPASADRILLNNPGHTGGSSLHAVALIVSDTLSGTFGNYHISNGNGTWTYSYYSTPEYNGNNDGQGSGILYADVNIAWSAAMQGSSVRTCTTVFNPGSGVSAPLEPTRSAPPAATTGDGIFHLYQAGITKMSFPSQRLGIAVGINLGTTLDCDTPMILLTFDQAATWMFATAVPIFRQTAASDVYDDAVPVIPYPAITGGDFMSVFFVSKSLGWAVGGNCFTCLKTNFAAGPGVVARTRVAYISVGYLLMTTNGATVWRNNPLFYTYDLMMHTLIVGDTQLVQNLFRQKIPGFLFDVQSDASGKHVFTVGAPYYTSSYSKANFLATYSLNNPPTILYSGDRGATWTLQSAPTRPSGSTYTLTSVAVQRGTTVWAVGGLLGTTYNGNGGGTIIGTVNGGFTWKEMVYPFSGTDTAPTFTCVALNGQAVWVGGFLKTSEYYPVESVQSDSYPKDGAGYTILVSLDGVNFNPVPVAALPQGFALTGKYGDITINPYVAYRDVYGITWDNNKHGWIYGSGFIMGTHDKGVTWQYETPNTVITNSLLVTTIASVPTSY